MDNYRCKSHYGGYTSEKLIMQVNTVNRPALIATKC